MTISQVRVVVGELPKRLILQRFRRADRTRRDLSGFACRHLKVLTDALAGHPGGAKLIAVDVTEA